MKIFLYIITTYIIISFITLLLIIGNNIKFYKNSKRINNTILNAFLAIFFPITWYFVLRDINRSIDSEK